MTIDSTTEHVEIVAIVPTRVVYAGTYMLEIFRPIFGDKLLEKEVGITRDDLQNILDYSVDAGCFNEMLVEEFGETSRGLYENLWKSKPVTSTSLPPQEWSLQEDKKNIDCYLEERNQLLAQAATAQS